MSCAEVRAGRRSPGPRPPWRSPQPPRSRRGGDREAGLDDVHAQPRQLVGDLQLLLHVQRDAGRLLAVAQRRVEDEDAVRVLCRWSMLSADPRGRVIVFLLLLVSGYSCCAVRAGPAAAYSPRRGRRRRRRPEAAPASTRLDAIRVALLGTTAMRVMYYSGREHDLADVARSWMNRWASAARSNGNDSATTGWITPRSISSTSGSVSSSSEPARVPPVQEVEAHHGLVLVHQLERVEARHRGDLRSALTTLRRSPVTTFDSAVHDQASARAQQSSSSAELAQRVEHDVDALARR